MSRLRAVLLTIATVALVVLSGAPASGHAYLVSSNPGDGERLDSGIHELRLEFSEHVTLGATHLELRDSEGHRVPVRDVSVVSDDADIEGPAAVTAVVPELGAGAYELRWETLSSDDLHRTAGVILFGVGRSVTPSAPATTSTRWDEALLHGLMLLALALAGGSLLGSRVRPGLGRRAVLTVTAAAALLSVLVLLDQTIAAGTGVGTAMSGAYGVRWSVRVAGLVAIAVAWSRARGASPTGLARALGWLGLVLVGTGTALLGHVGAPGGIAAVVAAAHVTAALAWSGAVCLVGIGVLTRRTALGVAGTREALRSFAAPAAACLCVVVVTGLFLSSRVVVSADAALLTTYGRTWASKVALVGLLAALAAYNHRRVRGPHDLDLAARGVRGEATVFALVLLLTGVLASSGTATDPSFRPVPTASSGQVSHAVADLQVSAGLRPNQPGSSVALVDAFDSRRPAPAPISGVDVSVGGSAPRAARSLGDGHWTAPVTLTRSGLSAITVTVHRPPLPDRTSRLRWTVGGGHPTRATVISRAPIRGPLLTASGILAGLAVAGWVVAAGRLSGRRRGRTEFALADARDTVGAARG
jgi:copper transport protein